MRATVISTALALSASLALQLSSCRAAGGDEPLDEPTQPVEAGDPIFRRLVPESLQQEIDAALAEALGQRPLTEDELAFLAFHFAAIPDPPPIVSEGPALEARDYFRDMGVRGLAFIETVLRTESDAGVRDRAMRLIPMALSTVEREGASAITVPLALRTLDDQDEDLRASAVMYLAVMAEEARFRGYELNERVLPVLRDLAQNGTGREQRFAAERLFRMGITDCIPADLLLELQSSDEQY